MPDLSDVDPGIGKNFYSFSSFNGAWAFGDGWQLGWQIPYIYLHLSNNAENITENGIADISFSIARRLFESKNEKWQLWAAIAAEAPTGRQPNNEYDLPVGFGISNGAWDFMIDVAATYDTEAFSLLVESGIRLPGTDDKEYQLGIQNYGRAWIYRSWIFNAIELTPQFGLGYDYLQTDNWYEIDQIYTGGHQQSASFQLGISKFQWSTFLRADLPINQNWAQGYVENQFQCSFQIQYQW